jgi:hypothetical protein
LSKQDLIRSVDLKLARANAQATAIAEQISGWLSRNPITVRTELREDRFGFRLIFNGFSEHPQTDNWGLDIGECVHNLRSALDNLAFALARLQQDKPAYAEVIHFPIFQDRAAFNKALNKKKSRVTQSLGQMPAGAASLIERLQPFQRDKAEIPGTPDSDPLVILQWLNNEDKHRVPSVVLVVPSEMKYSCIFKFEGPGENKMLDTIKSFEPLQPGMVISEHQSGRQLAEAHVTAFGEALVTIQSEQKREPVDKLMCGLSDYTAQVVDQFRGFFK